jgi:hypothetical protein
MDRRKGKVKENRRVIRGRKKEKKRLFWMV